MTLTAIAIAAACMMQAPQVPAPGGAPFGQGADAVDERARDAQRVLQREEELRRALDRARAIDQGGVLLGGLARAEDPNVALARTTVGPDAPRSNEVPAGLRAVIVRMDDPAWSAREQASVDAASGAWTTQELRKALDEPSLTPERRSRLEEALWSVWDARPRGAIGITMGQGPGGVLVTQVHDGFPASRVLIAGDVIVAIDGIPTPNNEALVALVQRRGPTERLRMTILRGAPGAVPAVAPAAVAPAKPDQREVEVELGDLAQLERDNPRTVLRSTGRRAAFDALMREERERLQRRPLPVEPGLPPGFVGSTVVAGGRQPAGTSVNPKVAIMQLRNVLDGTNDPAVRALLEEQIRRMESALRDAQRGGFGARAAPSPAKPAVPPQP